MWVSGCGCVRYKELLDWPRRSSNLEIRLPITRFRKHNQYGSDVTSHRLLKEIFIFETQAYRFFFFIDLNITSATTAIRLCTFRVIYI